MFRRPGSARKAAGILASSRELMNQVEPIRMKFGGLQNDAVTTQLNEDPYADLRRLIAEQSEQVQKPGLGTFLQNLGMGAIQSEFVDPNRSTVQNLLAAVPGAITDLRKMEEKADQTELSLAQARGKIAAEENQLIAQRQLMAQRDAAMTDRIRGQLFGSDRVQDYLTSIGVTYGTNPKTGQPVATFKDKSFTSLGDLREALDLDQNTDIDVILGTQKRPGAPTELEQIVTDRLDPTVPLAQRIASSNLYVNKFSEEERAAIRGNSAIDVFTTYPEFAGAVRTGKVERFNPGKTQSYQGDTADLLKDVFDESVESRMDGDDVTAFVQEAIDGEPEIVFVDSSSEDEFGSTIGRLTYEKFQKLEPELRDDITRNFPGVKTKIDEILKK